MFNCVPACGYNIWCSLPVCVRVPSATRSCAARDDNNKDNVCKPNIPAGLTCPPLSKTISLITRFGTNSTWLMPDIESHVDTVGGAKFITECDIQSAYWQIPISKKDCHKTAFVTSKGKYVFKVFPFGIANAPWIFQRVMSLAFANFNQPSGLFVCMVDVIACSATWEAHLRSLEDMFRALQTAGLTLQPSIIHFGPKEVQYLGHDLSADGLRMGEDGIKVIIDLKTSTTIKELRSVTVDFVRKFIPNLASIIEPLVVLTCKSVANRQTLRNHWRT